MWAAGTLHFSDEAPYLKYLDSVQKGSKAGGWAPRPRPAPLSGACPSFGRHARTVVPGVTKGILVVLTVSPYLKKC